MPTISCCISNYSYDVQTCRGYPICANGLHGAHYDTFMLSYDLYSYMFVMPSYDVDTQGHAADEME